MTNKPLFALEDILPVLPHRPPFLFVDRVMMLEPHKRIIAEKFIRDNAIRTAANYTAITSGNDLVLREYKNLLGADLPKG